MGFPINKFDTPRPTLPQIPRRVSFDSFDLSWQCPSSLIFYRAASRARGEYLRTHFKNMHEVAAVVSGIYIFRWIRKDMLTGFQA